MLVTEFYDGQGLGNQLWCYAVLRVVALDRGFQFGIAQPSKFKGQDLFQLDMGKDVIGGSGPEGGPPIRLPDQINFYYSEGQRFDLESGVDIRNFDELVQQLPDGCKLDGVLQDERYIRHRRTEINTWFSYKSDELLSDYANANTCVINFRGGDYKLNPKVFLRRRYWKDAISHMRAIRADMNFRVITDDVKTAKLFFPRFDVRHYGIAGDYQAINTAPYLILSNSSFGFFPAWLNKNLKVCIAPKYWWAHNISQGLWGCAYNIVSGWMYLDRKGNLSTSAESTRELDRHVSKMDCSKSLPIADATLVVSSFNNDLSWVPKYFKNYFVYEQSPKAIRSPFIDLSKVKFVPHCGSNISDYLTFIIDHYENLPANMFLVKGNVMPRHVRQQYFESICHRRGYFPIVDRAIHRVKFPLDYFGKDGIYRELSTDWYMRGQPAKYFSSARSFLSYFYDSPRIPFYSPFAIGTQVVVTREIIERIPKIVYSKLRTIVTHDGKSEGFVAECWLAERMLHRLWTTDEPLSSKILDEMCPLPVAFNEQSALPFRLWVIFLDIIARVPRAFINFSGLTLSAIRNRFHLLKNFVS
jgi:hypothetical protein